MNVDLVLGRCAELKRTCQTREGPDRTAISADCFEQFKTIAIKSKSGEDAARSGHELNYNYNVVRETYRYSAASV
jgi:hypothetical protein